MTLTAIILLILLGIIFLLLEILVIPGTGIVGIIGALLMAAGIYFAYQINPATGHVVLSISAVLSALMIWLSFRSKTWNRVMLHEELKERVNVIEEGAIKEGDTGKAVSRIAPMGKALINGKYVEVKSYGDYIPENSVLKVVKIEGNKIIVKSQE